MNNRIAEILNRDFSRFGIRGDVTVTETGVSIPAPAAGALVQALGRVDGASSVSRIRVLLDSRTRTDITLDQVDAEHLSRLLGDVERTKRRNDQIDRGQIPGPMNSREAMRLVRKHPGLFGRGKG